MSLDQSDLPALPALPPIKLNILQQTFTVGFLLVDIYIVLSSVTSGSEEGGGRREDGDQTDKFHHECSENQFCNCILNKAIISKYFHRCVGRGGAADQMKNLIDLQDLSCYQSWLFTVHQPSGMEQIFILILLPLLLPSSSSSPLVQVRSHLCISIRINKFFY